MRQSVGKSGGKAACTTIGNDVATKTHRHSKGHQRVPMATLFRNTKRREENNISRTKLCNLLYREEKKVVTQNNMA